MREFLPFVVIGLATGAVYGLAGLGLVLTYKTSGIFNIGYGAVACFAAFLFYLLHVENGWPWPVAAIVTVGLFAPAVGICLEVVARSLEGAPERIKVVATVGLILIAASIAGLWFPINAPVFPHFLPQSTVVIFSVFVTWEQIILFAFSLVASAALYWFFRSARLGIVMRGLVDSRDLVSMSGDSPLRVRRTAWIIGTVFAAIAGLLLAPVEPLDGVSLTTLVFAAFGAAAIGYFSSLPLTLLGGLVIGVAGSIMDKYSGTISWIGGLPPSLPFLILFVALIVTPRAKLMSRRVAIQAKVRNAYHAPLPIRASTGVIAVGLLAIVPIVQSNYIALWSGALINIVLFLSLGLLVRNSGQISLCHLAFAAVGACAFSHFISFGLPWFLSLALAALVAVPVGAVVAIPAVRLSGVFLALATLGFGLIAEDIFYTRNFMFGSSASGLASPRPHISIGPWHLFTDQGFYYVLLVMTALTVVAITLILNGRLGRLLRAMSDSQLALETRGTTSSVLKVIVFCIAAAMASMAGAFTGMLYHYSTGNYFQSFASIQLVVLVVIIVIGDPWYAVIGAVANTVIPGYLHAAAITPLLSLLFGVSAVFAVYGMRIGGVPMALQALLDRLGGRRPADATPLPAFTARERVPTSSVVPANRGGAAAGTGLEVRELSVSFGGVKAVDSVCLSAPMGKITGLIGPNGAGKTTTFNACSGLVRVTAGQVLLDDVNITGEGLARRARRGLGRTFQRPELCNSLTVRQNVALGCEAPLAGGNPLTQLFDSRSAARHISAAADEALDIAGITQIAELQVGLLSIGQLRLVELATVLVGRFKVLLLDEPSSGLDAHETELFGRVLQTAVSTRGLAILLVEHDMTLVRAVCDHVYVLDFGSLIFDGSPQSMQDSERVRAAYLGETASTG